MSSLFARAGDLAHLEAGCLSRSVEMKSTFTLIVLNKEVALDGKSSYLGYDPNPLSSANNLFPVRDISYVTCSPDGPGGKEYIPTRASS